MRTLQTWLADLSRMPTLQEGDREYWQPFRHTCTSRTLGADELADTLRQIGPVSGWLIETGRVVELEQQTIELLHMPLAGEFFRGDQHWQLSAHPRGCWLLHHHTLNPCSAEEATHLADKVEHLLASPRRGRLVYWRLWAPETEPDTNADLGPTCRIALLTAICKEC